MSKSNWRGHLALGGIAAFALFAISLALYLPQSAGSIEKYSEHKHASREYPKDEDAARESRIWLRWVLGDGRTDKSTDQGKEAKSESEKYTTALDLRAQWATAIAAAEMVALTRLQILFGLAGLIGLGLTVYYARHTAVAAIEATKIANRTANEAKRSSEQQLRAYIHLQKVEFKNVKFAEFPECLIRIQNFGQTPAYKVIWKSAIRYGKETPDFSMTEFDAVEWGELVIGPGGGFRKIRICDDSLGGDEIRAIEKGEACIWAWGRIDYIDAFDQPRYTTYCIHTADNLEDGGAYKSGNDAT